MIFTWVNLYSNCMQVGTSGASKDKDGPAWAPLRDNYMLTNPKLKDWDKKPVRASCY